MKKRLVLALLLAAAMNFSHSTPVKADVIIEQEMLEVDLGGSDIEDEEEEQPGVEAEIVEEIVEEEPEEEIVEEIVEEEPEEEIVEEHIHEFSEWIFDNNDHHSRYCTTGDGCEEVEYQDHYFGNDKTKASYYTCVCNYKNIARLNEVLAPEKESAITKLEAQSTGYGKYSGDNVKETLDSAIQRINGAESAEEIKGIYADASDEMKAVVLYDARNYETAQWDKELGDNIYSDELQAIKDEGNQKIYMAESLDDIAKIGETYLNKIKVYMAENPYVAPMIKYASQIAGTYTAADEASIVITVNSNGEAVMVLNENGKETIIDASGAIADGDVIVIGSPTKVYYIYMEDGAAYAIHEQAGRKGRDFGKEESGNTDPLPEIVKLENPVCPQCGAKLVLVSTDGDNCTWTCETATCGLVSERHHGVGELCVCAETCAHAYGTEGDERFTCIKCGEHVNEAKKAEAEKADAYKVLLAEFDAFKMTQIEAAEALGDEETVDYVESAKRAINAYAYDANLSREENEAVIENIVKQLAEDIAFYKNPDPESPKEAEPEIGEEIELKEGTYALFLDDEYVGIYTFAKYGKGWTIQDENGKYLGIVVENKEGYLSFTDTAFEWSYNGHAFRGSDKNGKQYCLASADSVSKPKVEASVHEIIED